jgi:hypothetical protein
MPEFSAQIPIHRLIVMPWRWGTRGRSAAIVLLFVWLLIYAVSFPPMFLWLSTNAIEPDLVREMLWGMYVPLDWLTENSDACFSAYLWELKVIQESPRLRWLLPAPEPLSNAAPTGPGTSGAPRLGPLEDGR